MHNKMGLKKVVSIALNLLMTKWLVFWNFLTAKFRENLKNKQPTNARTAPFLEIFKRNFFTEMQNGGS